MARKGFDLAALAREQMGAGEIAAVESVREIPVALIDANEGNFYARSAIDELAANIELLGLIQPVAVKPGKDGRWTLIDGERRYQAVKLLGWETIRAVVYRPASDVFEELMLISANMQQRKMTSADLSKQAERYTECLAALKRSGVAIPGRLRKAVAEAFDVSESRLGRLAAIRKGLIPELLARFDAGEMAENTAYEYSRMEPACQAALQDKYAESTWRLVVARSGYERLCRAQCPEGSACGHIAPRVRAMCEAGYAKCGPCCLGCDQLAICKSSCPQAAEERLRRLQELETARAARKMAFAERAAAYEAGKAREAAEREARKLAANAAWLHFAALREAAGVSVEDVASRMTMLGLSPEDLDAAEKRQDGYIDADETPADVMTLTDALAVAELLGCDVRELAGGAATGDSRGWDWRDGSRKLPDAESGATVCCWGERGFRTVGAADYAAARELFPGLYDWWCLPVPPEAVSKSDTEEEGGEDDAAD